MPAPLDNHLQFLSWLFEGALPHCICSCSPTACEEREALATSCSSTLHEIEQNRRIVERPEEAPEKICHSP